MSEEVTIKIDGDEFRFWENIAITLPYDGISQAGFKAPFNPDDATLRKTFEPMTFKPTTIQISGETQLTGRMLTAIPADEEESTVVNVSMYSNPGILNDNMTPVEAYTKVFKLQTLDVIAAKIAEPFGVGVKFYVPVAEINRFKKVAYSLTQNPLAFLIGLAKQRDLLVFSDAPGNLGFQRQVALGQSVGKLTKGISPLSSVQATPNAQAYHSRVTAFKKSKPGNQKGAYYTTLNPFITSEEDVLRPLNVQVPDGDGADAKTGALAGYKRMITSSAVYTANVATWRDPKKKLWKPNTTVKIKAPRSMIYDFYEFLITQVILNKTAEAETAVLSLAIHGDAQSLPWAT